MSTKASEGGTMKKKHILFLSVICVVLLSFSNAAKAQSGLNASNAQTERFKIAFFIPELSQSFIEKYRRLNSQSKKVDKKVNNTDNKLKYITKAAKL
jgi:hypothetical protein